MKPDGLRTTMTGEQMRVVESILAGERVMAKAGAGSGKTMTLVEAYASLIGRMQGVANPYDRILAITFTNEAAYNLRKSIFGRTGGDVRALLTDNIATIHSFCNTILSSHLVELSISPDYQISDDEGVRDDAFRVIDEIVSQEFSRDEELRECIASYGYEGSARTSVREAIYRAYCAVREQGTRLEDAEDVLARGEAAFRAFSHSTLRKGGVETEEAGRVADRLARTSSVLGRYMLKFWRRYEREKRQSGNLTFNDVLYYVYQLLTDHPAVRDYYRAKFDYVMVDEFQDTDRLQFDIISMITGADRQAFVGDLKQSIYEWRNADPSIMTDLEAEIRRSGEGVVLEMADNFRSTPGLIDFFNLIFPGVFGGGFVEYTPMRHANTSVTDSAEPSVRIMMPGGGTVGERRSKEAELVCAEVIRLLDSGTQVYDESAGEWRGACLKDMAILFRSRSAVRTYEQALRSHRIPYIHVQSDSFFEKNEVIDLMNYMNHLAEPSDPFYTFSSLRSPLFGCGDETLLTLSMNRFDLQRTIDDSERGERRKLSVMASLDEFCARHMNGFAHRLLSEAIARTRADLVYLSSSGGKQAYANMLKLVDMLRGMEEEGPIGLREAVRRLNRRAEEGVGEAEYPMNDEKSDALRIMTVHASKGLEFPIVFIADSSRIRPSRRMETFYHGKLGIVPAPPRRRAGDAEGMEMVNREAAAHLDSRSEQEDRRVFYVSLTRAKQFLYISRFRTGQREENSWNGLLSSVLPLTDSAQSGVVEAGCRLMLIGPADGEGARLRPRTKRTGHVAFMEVAVSRPQAEVITSVTELADYLVCPYRRKLSRAMPSARSAGARWEALERGRLAHRLLQEYDYANARLPGNAALLSADLSAREGLERFVASEYGAVAANASAANGLKREFPFLLRRGKHTISGKIDMFAAAGNEAMVVDYKTGELAAHRQEYGNQLKLYALALRRLTGREVFRLVSFGLDKPAETSETTADAGLLDAFGAAVDSALDDIMAGKLDARPSVENCSGCERSPDCPFRYGPGSTKTNKA